MGPVALVAGSVLLTLFLLDLFFAFRPLRSVGAQRAHYMRTRAAESGGTFDERTKLQVVMDFRGRGVDAQPATVNELIRPAPRFSSLLPLGGVSRTLTVLCNELGPWEVFTSDEHGFRNPPGIWSLDSLEIAGLGDSFVQGLCVPDDQTFMARIRARVPATLGLGGASNGPLMELALMREYLPGYRPRIVLWFYYEANDLIDLESEKQNAILRRYLNPGFTQGLAARQDTVDAMLRGHFLEEQRAAEQRPVSRDQRSLGWHVVASLKLFHLRQSFRTAFERPATRPCCDLPLLDSVLARADTTVRGWGGTLVFVYLPSAISYYRPGARPVKHVALGDSVLLAVRRQGVPIIDLRAPIRESGRAREYFPFPDSHFGDAGNRAVADLVLESLQRQGLRQ